MENFSHIVYAVLLQFTLFWQKFRYVAIYFVLLGNLFYREIHNFVWRKIEPKIVSVEKNYKYQGMIVTDLGLSEMDQSPLQNGFCLISHVILIQLWRE